jgi:hypothetical protein
MAKQGPDKPDLSPHPLVKRLQGDSDHPASVVPLTGYFGPCKRPESIRLYTSLDFSSYFEIPTSAILATCALDEDDELSPTLAYVKAGTPVEAVRRSTQPVDVYLQGGITSGYLHGPLGGGSMGAGLERFISKCSECNTHSPVHAAVAHTYNSWWCHLPTHLCVMISKCPGECQSHIP